MAARRVFPALVAGLVGALAAPARAEGPPDGGAQEENLLAEPAPPPAARAAPAQEPPAGQTFGAELLNLLDTHLSWSGYGDVRATLARAAPAEGEPGSDFSANFNPILTARVGEAITAEAEVELTTTEGVLFEYAVVDYTVGPGLTLRAGKFLAPIGQFNPTLHPHFRWAMLTAPIMFEEVMPIEWSPVGLEVHGSAQLASVAALSYAAFVCNGFSGPRGFLASERVLNAAHDANQDVNGDKGVGGQLALELLGGRRYGALRLGFSAYTGAIDPSASQRVSLADADFRLRLGDMLFQGEAAQSYLGPESSPLQPFERGAYVMGAYSRGWVTAAVRWDYAETRPFGAEALIRRYAVASLKVAPSIFYSVRGELREPLVGPEGDHTPEGSLSIAFAF